VLTGVFHRYSSSLIKLYCTRANAFNIGNGGPFPRGRAKTCQVLQLIHFLHYVLALRQVIQCVMNRTGHFVQGMRLDIAGACYGV